MKAELSKRVRLILVIISTLLAGIVLAVFVGYRLMTDAPRQLISAIDQNTAMTIRNLRQVATRDGVREWQLDARSANLSNGGKTADLEYPTVTFFLKDQSQVALTAEHGRLQINENDFEASGNIFIRNKGYELRTEKLQYRHKGRIIIATTPVEIVSGRMHFRADGMKVDLSANRILLEKNVEGAIGMRRNE